MRKRQNSKKQKGTETRTGTQKGGNPSKQENIKTYS